MTEAIYNVVFSGEIAQGYVLEDVHKNVSAIFKNNPKRIDRFFSGHKMIVKKNIDMAAAKKYQKAFLKAGAVCAILPSSSSQPPEEAEAEPQTHKTAPPDSGPIDPLTALNRIKAIPVNDDGGLMTFFPRLCDLMTNADNGINLNRRDLENVSFEQILFISVFNENGITGDRTNLLFFLNGISRPFIIDAEKINYKAFPDVAGSTPIDLLRNFILFICTRNAALATDTDTYEYLQGKPEVTKIDNAAMHIDAIGNTLASKGLLA